MKQYICKKIDTCLKPTGALDHSIWKDIETIVLVRNDGEKLDPAYSTQAQICRDDENLYIRFLCKDPYIWATMKGRNEPLWEEEVVEVFIDPDGDGRNYIELEVNPLNNTLTLLVPSAGSIGNWKENAKFELKGLKTWVTKYGVTNLRHPEPQRGEGSKVAQRFFPFDFAQGQNDGMGWVVDIIVPFENFRPWADVPPKEGDIWRLNLYRVERPVKEKPEDCILIAWSPTLRDTFHVPQLFGEIVFVGEKRMLCNHR